MLEQVLYNLLNNAIGYAQGKNIRISAKTFHNVILVHTRYNCLRQECDIEKSFEEIKNVLEPFGGCVYINDSKTDETTVSVTFLNHQLRVA
jgi:signal transduction histidine kinase